MYDKRSFEHSGKSYEVRIASDGRTYWVRTFLDGKPANGSTYSVEIETQLDAVQAGIAFSPIEELINAAMTEITGKR